MKNNKKNEKLKMYKYKYRYRKKMDKIIGCNFMNKNV